MQPLALLGAIGLLALCSNGCLAQERPDEDTSQMSRDQWRSRVQSSRERAEIARRERKAFTPLTPTTEELAEAATRRVLEDDSLRPGDLVSTNRGLFRFEGAPDRERRPDDFVRIR